MTDQNWATLYTDMGLFETCDVTGSSVRQIVDMAVVSDKSAEEGDSIAYRVIKVPSGFILQTLNANTLLTESSVFVPYVPA